MLVFEEFSDSLEKSFEFFSRAGSRVVDADKGGEHGEIIAKIVDKVNSRLIVSIVIEYLSLYPTRL